MKIFKRNIELKVEWSFACDGQTLRSSVIGGYQGEIYKSYLTIVNGASGGVVSRHYVGSRQYGMKHFGKKLAEFMGSKK